MWDKRLIKYLIITFAVSWICWGTLSILIKLDFLKFSHPIATILHIMGGFGPTIATLFVFDEKVTVKSVANFIFKCKKRTLRYLLLFCFMEIFVIGLSSMQINSAIPLYLIPIVFLQVVLIYGGNEELGWRGVMQPIMESKMPFPVATLITGVVWSVWHIPLWYVDGTSQQNMSFLLFTLLGVLLSFWLATVYKRTQSVFFCSVLHGLNNTLLASFVIKVNMILVIGFIVMLICSIYLWYSQNCT